MLACLAFGSLAAGLPGSPNCAEIAPVLACGRTVAPATLRAVIAVESGGQVFAVHVNGAAIQPESARSGAEAAALAEQWIARGSSVDLGLMQVNSRNLAALGATVPQMFEPCANIRAGAAILTADYLAARATRPDPQDALQAALSAYNTGDAARGRWNGYVARYYGPPIAGVATHPAPNPYLASPSVYHRSPSDG